MRQLIIISCLLLFINISHSKKKENNLGNLWPYPQSSKIDSTYYSIDSKNFNFVIKTKGKCNLLDETIQRYKKLLFLEDCSLVSENSIETQFEHKIDFSKDDNFKGVLNNITVWVNHECEDKPHFQMNEMYSIEIDSQNFMIFGENIWGIIRAFETLSQLMENVGLNQFIINTTSILDFPRFSYRGLMLDTSRHYVPIRELKQNLDAMAYNKMNVFHWHIVDDQSFPYVSQIYPDLSLKGAYNPKTHIYTIKDINDIIEFARLRGIRVLVEFDTPGHTQSWGKGQPGLLTPCYNGETPNGQFGPIDPIKESSYEFIKTLFTEVSNRFPDQYMHLGGDEVDFGCWATNPDIRKYMASRNITNFSKLEEIYIQRVLDIVKALNRSYIVWQEVFDNKVNIKSDTIVHVWKGAKYQNELYNITKMGYHTLLSSCWYLNYISYGTDWPKYYSCDPQDFGGTEQQNKLVIGGEACMWGEWVDATNLMSRTWPRGSAVAERLWSPKQMKDPKAANTRFNGQHCRMQKRGLAVEPANGPGHCQCDYAI